jgi:hypothetical protein
MIKKREGTIFFGKNHSGIEAGGGGRQGEDPLLGGGRGGLLRRAQGRGQGARYEM